MSFECFENLVGITNKECDCHEVPEGKTYNITESTSGQFLTDYFDIEAAALRDCDTASDMFDDMNRAIERAQRQVLIDFEQASKKKYASTFHRFSNLIGTKNHQSSNQESPGAYSGMRLHAKGAQGVYMRISKVSIESQQAESSRRLLIVDSTGATLFTSDALELTANEQLEVDVNITVPLFWNESEELSYYIVHNLVKPVRNKPNCGCSGHSVKYKSHVYPYGTSTLGAFDSISGYSATKTAWSVIPKVEISCHTEQGICDNAGEQDLDVLATTILYRAAQFLAEERLQSNKIGRYTLLSAEGLAAKVDECVQEYESGITWLVQNMPMPPCFKCKPGAWKQTIRI